ncbi:unnamed protein product [Lasius platythorax]|uniref:MULE transposase domain-containing protein n=1 Tax=Lasius platythorax TaxID=488582 RepID=A0AAV2NNT2_9HYME
MCRNTFRGYAETQIGVEGLRVKITTRDTRTENHEVVKRPLNGKRRKEVQKELKAEGSSEWRKRQAREIMRPNETEPSISPSGDVFRQAHKKGVDAELGVKENDGRDLVRTIEEMSLKPEYIGLIHDVGSLPFHVCYSTQAQLHAYKEYCRLNKNKSVISLDSTGSVVRRLDRKSQKSGHIFLYAIVINFDNTTIFVYQMLTEKHTTEFIELWLRQWLRMGAPKPKQKIFYFTCVVGLQTYQDVEIDYSEILTAKDARKILEEEIAVRAIKVNFDESAGDKPEHRKAQATTKCNEVDPNSSSIGDWIDGQVGRAKKKQRDGEELNPFFFTRIRQYTFAAC